MEMATSVPKQWSVLRDESDDIHQAQVFQNLAILLLLRLLLTCLYSPFTHYSISASMCSLLEALVKYYKMGFPNDSIFQPDNIEV